MDLIKNYLPMIVRYALIAAMGALITHGFISPEQKAYLTSNLDAVVGSIVLLVTVLYGLLKHPSPTAMEAARAIDRDVIPLQAKVGSSIITIRTPTGVPDVIIPMPAQKVG